MIGPQSAERLKLELASATLPDDLGEQVTIKGVDVLPGVPGLSRSLPANSIRWCCKLFAR